MQWCWTKSELFQSWRRFQSPCGHDFSVLVFFSFLCTLQLEWNEPSVNSASFCRLEQNDVFLCPATPSVNPASFCQLQQNEVFLGPVPRHGFYLPSVSFSRTKSFLVQFLVTDFIFLLSASAEQSLSWSSSSSRILSSFCQLQQNEVFLGPVPRHGFYLPSVSFSRTKSFSVQLLHQWIQLPSVSLRG